MPTYLNHRAILTCTHGGRVLLTPPPYRSLHPMGSPVVTDVDLMRAPIIGCLQMGPGLKPCTRIILIVVGRAGQIFIDQQIPILDTLYAMTDGVAPGFVSPVFDGGSNVETIGSLQGAALANAAANGKALCEICA